MTKEALKLALEALEEYVNVVVSVNDPNEWTPKVADAGEPARKAIIAIKEALAQPEPVAWGMEQSDGEILDVITPEEHARLEGGYTIPLYRHPQRTWVGLTFDERIELAKYVDWPVGAYCEYAEKIEAKLKEKNELR
jgi:hypothetical protein